MPLQLFFNDLMSDYDGWYLRTVSSHILHHGDIRERKILQDFNHGFNSTRKLSRIIMWKASILNLNPMLTYCLQFCHTFLTTIKIVVQFITVLGTKQFT